MEDRELLERAAKAAGLEFMWEQPRGARYGSPRARLPGHSAFPIWNPLTDDGDALRLAVKLKLDIYHYGKPLTEYEQVDAVNFTGPNSGYAAEMAEGDRFAAARRAIVRAAAALA